MRILHILRDLGLTGVPRFVGRFAKGVAERGEQLETFVHACEGGPMYEEMALYAHINIHHKAFKYDARVISSIDSYARSCRASCLLVHGYPWGLLAALRLHLPTVIVFHVDPSGARGLDRLSNHAARLLLRRSNTQAVGVSRYIAQKAMEEFPRSMRAIQVIYNGIEVRCGASVTPRAERKDIMCIGTVCPVKGQHFLLEAQKLLFNKGRRFTLHIVGQGPTLEELKRRASAHGLSSWVVFHGQRPAEIAFGEIKPAIVVVPSLHEPFGYTILEAWNHGIPVVASAVEGPAELVESGNNGLLFPPGSVGALANALEDLMEDPLLYEKLSQGALASVDNYSLEKTVSSYIDLIRSLSPPGVVRRLAQRKPG